MDKSPVRTETRSVEAGDGGGDIVMGALHRGAAGQRHDDGTSVERIERFGERLDVDGATRLAIDRDGLHAQDARGLGDRVVRLAAMEQLGVGKGFAREVERPDIALGAARDDRPPKGVVIVALPKVHQPGDGLAFRSQVCEA
jgi:hypothetical protein